MSRVLDNLQEAAKTTYEKNWQAYGLGFIVVKGNKVEAFSVYKGYRGIRQDSDIRELLPADLHFALANNPDTFFGVLQNSPDKGEEGFEEDKGRHFPLESEKWFAITMGAWGNNNFSDESQPWYDQGRPSASIVHYLETKPDTIDFGWIDPKRTPLVIAVNKDGSSVFVVDNYTGTSDKGYFYSIDRNIDGIVSYNGVRNKLGEQV